MEMGTKNQIRGIEIKSIEDYIFYMKTILVTGGAGFIGSHVVRLFVEKYPEYKIVNLDKLTYAGNLANLKDIRFRHITAGNSPDIVFSEYFPVQFVHKNYSVDRFLNYYNCQKFI